MMDESKHIKMVDVIPYVKQKTGMLRSRATIYNWATKGVKVGGQTFKLQHKLIVGQMVTTTEWVDTFLARINQQ